MTTIPSIPGWQVKVDGKTVKMTKVANYFIAVKTKPGLHKISFVYTPPLFYYGVIISLLALLLLLIINRKFIAKKIHTWYAFSVVFCGKKRKLKGNTYV